MSAAPSLNATRVVSVDAPAERIWPWLVQIGIRLREGGFHAIDQGRRI